MMLYEKQFENDLDLNDNYKIYDVQFFTKLDLSIFKDLGEVMVKPPSIYYIYKALSVLCTVHPDS